VLGRDVPAPAGRGHRVLPARPRDRGQDRPARGRGTPAGPAGRAGARSSPAAGARGWSSSTPPARSPRSTTPQGAGWRKSPKATGPAHASCRCPCSPRPPRPATPGRANRTLALRSSYGLSRAVCPVRGQVPCLGRAWSGSGALSASGSRRPDRSGDPRRSRDRLWLFTRPFGLLAGEPVHWTSSCRPASSATCAPGAAAQA
jgi:hypothetical protein